jgi:rubrerythrin
MRKEQLLTAVPPAPVRSLGELYAIAFDLAQKAAQRYGALAERIDDNFWPVRGVFEVLAKRERDRCNTLSAACLADCGKRPDTSDLRWPPIDLVPSAEIADIGDSSLSTPYTAWALATRHRQRAFVFWTYVIALAEDSSVRRTAERLAREALSDGNLLRHERRLAWRAERNSATAEATAQDGTDEPASAPLLESLLLKDMVAWSQGLTSAQRDYVLAMDPYRLPPHFPTPPDASGGNPSSGEIAQIKRRALRRAEQLSKIYLDEADRAVDQSSMELAQKLAAQSIMRLAGLRQLASESGFR